MSIKYFHRVRVVARDGVATDLTPKRAQLFMALARNGTNVTPFNQLGCGMESSWDDGPRKSIRSHITAMNKAFEPLELYILSVYGDGFKLSEAVSIEPKEDELTLKGDQVQALHRLLARCTVTPAVHESWQILRGALLPQ